MSATDATVAVPAEEVKVVETPAEPAPAEAPAAEQPATATEEVAPAAVRFFIPLFQRVSCSSAGSTQGRRAQSCCEYPVHNRSRIVDTFSFRNPLLRLPPLLPQSLLPRPLLSPPRKMSRP